MELERRYALLNASVIDGLGNPPSPAPGDGEPSLRVSPYPG
jgi:hypothetical protein